MNHEACAQILVEASKQHCLGRFTLHIREMCRESDNVVNVFS